MSKVVLFPGLDISPRQHSFRARVRVSPFYDLTKTFPTELDAASWGIVELQRLNKLRDILKSECRLPKSRLTREDAVLLGLIELIDGHTAASIAELTKIKPESSIGHKILVAELLDSYLEHDTALHATNYSSKVTMSKKFFGNTTLADITLTALNRFKELRRTGDLGNGRSTEPVDYMKTNRDFQARLRAKRRGTPTVAKAKAVYPVSDETIRKEISFLRRAVKAYVNRIGDADFHSFSAYMLGHPVFFVKLPPKGTPRERRISNEEIQALLKGIKCPEKRSAFLLVLYMTLRRSEILSLRIEDIDWPQCEVKLRAPMIEDPKNPGNWIKQPKSKTATRMVPLIPEAINILKKICSGRASGKVFEFSPTVFSQAVGRGCSKANIMDLRVHDGRRESVSWLHDVYGLTMEELTTFTGHTDVAVLMRHYFKPSASKLADKISSQGLSKREFDWEELPTDTSTPTTI